MHKVYIQNSTGKSRCGSLSWTQLWWQVYKFTSPPLFTFVQSDLYYICLPVSLWLYKTNHIYFVIVINIINIIQAKIISCVTNANKEGCFILATERNAQLFHTAARTIIWEFRNWVTFKLWTLNCILKLGLKLSALENEIIRGV